LWGGFTIRWDTGRGSGRHSGCPQWRDGGGKVAIFSACADKKGPPQMILYRTAGGAGWRFAAFLRKPPYIAETVAQVVRAFEVHSTATELKFGRYEASGRSLQPPVRGYQDVKKDGWWIDRHIPQSRRIDVGGAAGRAKKTPHGEAHEYLRPKLHGRNGTPRGRRITVTRSAGKRRSHDVARVQTSRPPAGTRGIRKRTLGLAVALRGEVIRGVAARFRNVRQASGVARFADDHYRPLRPNRCVMPAISLAGVVFFCRASGRITKRSHAPLVADQEGGPFVPFYTWGRWAQR